MQQKNYYKTNEIAAMLDVTEETVRGYITAKEDKLPAYKIGRGYRVKIEDFERWMEQRKNTRDDRAD